MNNPITLTYREVKEIQLCMYYIENLQHGTVGHNRMILIAKLAHAVGFVGGETTGALIIPENVKEEEVKDSP